MNAAHIADISLEDRQLWIRKVLSFLDEIDLPYTFIEDGSESGFLPSIKVVDGGLHIYGSVFPGDILHEAGHLCTIPLYFRSQANGDLREVFQALSAFIESNAAGLMQYPEDPLVRGALQCSDPEATAWQYAAAQYIGLPDTWVFPPDSYSPEGPESILLSLRTNTYIGINGLQAAGWTSIRKNPVRALPVYPEFAFWKHPATREEVCC